MIVDEHAEIELINEVRERLGDIDYNIGKAEIRRFLRARNYDIDKSAEMLTKSIEWRKECKFDEAITWKMLDKIVEEFPYSVDGKDKDGRAVVYICPGRWGIRKMIMKGFKSEMERNIYHTIANIMKAVEESGFEQFRIIVDLAELSYWKVAHYESVQMVLQVAQIYEKNFPERLYSAILINAPWSFHTVFPLVKAMMTGTTVSKIEIFDSNTDKYLAAILDNIEVSKLPTGFLKDYDKLLDSYTKDNNN